MLNENIREEIWKRTGRDFDNDEDILRVLFNSIEYLHSHNKNLTKNQYDKVDFIYEIVDVLYNYDAEYEAYLGKC